MRVAFFGGTFDPIHRGHLRLASATADAYALDRVLFVPVGNQPLKPGPPSPATPTASRWPASLQSSPPPPATGNQQTSNRPPLRRLTLDIPRSDGSPNYTVRLAGRARPRAAQRIPLRPHRGRQLPRPAPLALSRSACSRWPSGSWSAGPTSPSANPSSRRSPSLPPSAPASTCSPQSTRRSLPRPPPPPASQRPLHRPAPPAVADYIQTHGLYR